MRKWCASIEEKNTASRLQEFIKKIDGIIFPENPARVLIHVRSERNCAMYTRMRNTRNDYYSIFAKNLLAAYPQEKEMMFRICRNGRVRIFKNRSLSLNAYLMGIACHEVRHRLQYRGEVKSFAQDLSNKKSKLLRYSAYWIEIYFATIKKKARTSAARKRLRLTINRRERDAAIIETMIAHNFEFDNSIRKAIKLLLLGTNKKTALGGFSISFRKGVSKRASSFRTC